MRQLALIAFILLISTAFALPFDTKTENGLKVGIQPVSNVINGDKMTTCYWAQLPTATMTKPSISASSFGFSKTANISSTSTQLVKANLDYKYETYTEDNCTTDKDGKEVCNPYNQTDRIDTWTYPTAATSNEVLYCFDTVLKKDKNNHVQLPSSNSFNITLSGLKADPDWDACGIINASGTYDLTADVYKATGNCFTINSSGVTIDCHGFTIQGANASSSRGITSIVAGYNVRNCVIKDFATGIYIGGDAVDYSNITNNTFSSGFATSCSATSGACCAIYQTGADYSVISDNVINGRTTGFGIALNTATTTDNNITNNTVYLTATAYISSAASNSNIYQNNTAIGAASSGFSFASMTSSSIIGNFAYNVSTGATLTSGSNNNYIARNTLSNTTSYSFRLTTSSINTITDNYFQMNWQQTSAGVVYLLSLASNNTFENNTINSTNYGAQVYNAGGRNNTFINNTLIGNNSLSYGFVFAQDVGGFNTILRNNITSYKWVNDPNDTNNYNDSTSGNIWNYANGTGVWERMPNGSLLNTTSPPSWSDSGYGVNSTNWPGFWVSNGTDYKAWTANAAGEAPAAANYTNITAISIWPSSPTTNLSCNITAQNSVEATMLVNITFYKNGVNQSTNITYNITNNTVSILGNITPLTGGDNWSCSAQAWTSTNTSALNYSANVTVQTVASGTADYVDITTLSISPVSPYVNSTLQCSATAQSNNSSTINITYSWLRNGTNQTAYVQTILVNNNTATIANLTLNSIITGKGDNWSCAVQAWDSINASGLNYSSNVTVINSNPMNATISAIQNLSLHTFNFTAYADDSDNGTDITNWNVNISYGTCQNVSNSNAGNRKTVKMNCTYTNPAYVSFNITFIDASSASNYSATSWNTYPDLNNVSLTAPTITGTATVGNTLTCNNQTWTDADGDIENLTSRTWQWYNGTATIIGQTTSTFVIPQGWVGSQVKCQESVVAQNWTTSTAANNSSATTITNSNPENATIASFTNSTTAHVFNVTAYAEDADGASDITNWNLTISAGTCVNASNTAVGNRRAVNLTCTGTAPATASITITFKDAAGLMANTSTSSNAYPDHGASLTQPTITGTPQAGQTLTCNAGTFSDIDSDSENTGARAWQWYNSTTAIGGATSSTWLIPAGWTGSQVKCKESAVATTWTTSSATNNSSLTTILNSAPTNISMNFTNATMGHWFYVNASTTDADGGSDITYWNITTNLGSCINYSNSTNGNYRYASFNCSSSNQGTASIRVSFNDTTNSNISINNTNTYPDPNNASLTAPTITPNPAYKADTLTCNVGVFSDLDGDIGNASSITYKWFKNGTLITGQTAATLAPTQFNKTFSIICEETEAAQNWTTSTAIKNSSALVISNTLPTTPSALLPNGGEVFNGTNVNVNWTASTDADGDALTYYVNWTNDSWATNTFIGSTSATNLNWDITGYPTLTTYKVVVIAGDGSGFSANVSSAATFTINHTTAANNTAPNITAIGLTPTTAYANTPLICNVTAQDAESISLTIFYGWYKNGANMSLSGSVNVSNATNTNIINLTSGFVKGDNISCYAIAYDGQNYSSLNFSNNVTILNSNPVNATIDSFTNATNTHSFLMNAHAQDVDGAADITNWNISIDLGSCVNVSSSNAGVTKSVVMNCTSTQNSTATIGITFKDAAGLTANSSTATAGYPYANATLTAPAISPSFPLMNDSFLNCTAGVFSTSPFADTENISNRTWKWFLNGTELIGYTNQTLFNTTYNNTDVLICEETASNNTWGGYASANSSGVTVGTSLSISTAIIYPPSGSSYGPSQCSQLVTVQTNHTNPSDAGTLVTCRFYNWNGFANTTYVLNGTATATGGNSSVNFTIPQSSPPNWIVNCTITVAGVNATTQNVSFTNTGNGPNFCNTNGTAAGENWAPIMLFLVIMALLVVGYVFFVQGIPLLLKFPEVATPLKFIYICFLVFFGTVFGMSLGSELVIFDWLVQLSMAGIVGGSIFFAIGLFRGAGDWIKANWGV